jgi:small subunit ribosomal protein S21
LPRSVGGRRVRKNTRNRKGEWALIQVIVKDGNVEKAIRELKRKLQRDGLYTEMKRRSAYEKPSNKRKRKRREAIRRIKKLARLQEGG